MATNFVKVGTEQQVNLNTANNQNDADVAALSDGRFFVAYEREFTPGTDIDIHGRFINADGTPAGTTILIDNDGGNQINPAVAARADGGATVVFLDNQDSQEIEARTVSSAGVVGAEFNVLVGADPYTSVDAATLADGRILVVADQGGPTVDVAFNFINAAGTGSTNSAAFIDSGANDQTGAVVAAFGNNALVVYLDNTGGNNDVVGRFYNGTSFGAEFAIANAAAGLDSPDVAALSDGRFIVVWSNDDTDNVSARFVSATGAIIGGTISIAGGGGDQDNPRVAATPDGGFVVTWQDNSGTIAPDNVGGPSNAVHARRFDATGAPAGDAFLVNTSTTNAQSMPAIATNAAGGGYIAFDDFSVQAAPGDTDPPGVRGQAFQATVETINGTAGDDNITNTYEFGETINGLAGNDFINGRGGNDVVDGGDNSDTIFGGDGDDNLSGGNGDDTLFGNLDNDTLNGGAGDDVVNGGGGNDNINGGTGNDNLLGLSGDDTIEGGDGNDGINGGDGNDTLTGGAGSDNIFGGIGNDSLNGGNDSDIVRGEDGDDTVRGGDGFDIVQGDAGNDQVFGEGADDRISGGLGNDTVDGGDGDDFAFGEQGTDTMIGGNGNDTLFGGIENDVLQGDGGNDALNGQGDNDTLNGGTGDDVLTGEAGVDTYVFTAGMGRDTITDFGYTYGAPNPDGGLNILIAGGQNNEDTISISQSLAPNFAFIQSNASQVAGPAGFPQVVIDFGGGNSLTLINFRLSDLQASDFTFV